MALLLALFYLEPGLPHFGWNPEMMVVSIDGFPILLQTFKTSVDSSLQDMKAKMDELFQACQWDDILAYINFQTNPNNAGNWLFSIVQGKYVTNAGNLWEWFASLNELSSIMFYCIVLTWEGEARATYVKMDGAPMNICDFLQAVDFEIVDEEDAGLLAIHDAFNHSRSLLNAESQFQSGVQKPPPESHSTELNYEKKLFNRLLGPLKTTIHNATQ
ncbi:hypothetical protein EDD22DRAFT_848523 [Suillus occidentalis]|nr:hypothetical protein EDD22DRAFT_848523 [Suillus occidentalis]